MHRPPRRAIAPDDERSLRSERNHKAENKVMELADETAGVWYVANYESAIRNVFKIASNTNMCLTLPCRSALDSENSATSSVGCR